MKIERAGRAAQLRAIAGYGRTSATAEAVHSDSVSAKASILGIPESEFTPRVRDAVMTLMAEVDSLRRELQQAQVRLEEIEREADRDQLLPLLNRRAFVREVTRLIGMASRYGTRSSLVYVDLDNFKEVNDAHGHAAGDAVLAHVSDTILAHVRSTDIVARLGGDEFGVILVHTGREQAEAKARALAEALAAAPTEWNGTAIAVSFSYGAFELTSEDSADLAIASADQAMYVHKRAR